MNRTDSPARSDLERRETNRRFYDVLWTDARLIEPDRFNTWPLVASLRPQHPRRLEIAPGLRPRLPIAGTRFVDQSAPAVAKLRERGATAIRGGVTSLPFADGVFDLVGAFDTSSTSATTRQPCRSSLESPPREPSSSSRRLCTNRNGPNSTIWSGTVAVTTLSS